MTKPAIQTLFPYVGAKSKLIRKWRSAFPKHEMFVSVFGGSATDILFKRKSKLEVFNDLDDDINNVFRVLRKQEAELIQLVCRTPARSRSVYHEAVEILESSTDALARAWAFLVVTHQTIRTKHPVLSGKSGYAALKKCDHVTTQWVKLPETIRMVADRFKQVQLERLDFRELIPKFDSDHTFFFVDPPYHFESDRTQRLYVHEMNDADHAELLALLKRAKGMVWLCGYDCSLYRTELAHWRVTEHATATQHHTRSPRSEMVWTNFIPRRKVTLAS